MKFNTDFKEIQTEVKRTVPKSNKGALSDVRAPKSNQFKKLSSAGQDVYDFYQWAGVSAYLSQPLIKCQIQAVFDVEHTGVLPLMILIALSHLRSSKYSPLCGEEKTETKMKKN